MNKKLIAVAVAGVVAAPAAYADISAYGRINNRIVIADNDDVNMETSGSRFGFKGSGDMGNGMSAFARYEFSTTTDNASNPKMDNKSGIGRRLAFVGMSGPFGSVSLGQQWSAYFQNLGTHASLNIIKGPGQIGPFRTGNTIQYANTLGPVSLKLDARVDDADDGGGNGLGGGVTITPMDNFTLAGAFDSNDDADKDTVGIAAIAGFGGITVTLAHEQSETGDTSETNNTLLWLGAGVTEQLSLTVGYGTKETEEGGSTSEKDELALIGVLNMGGGLKLWGQFHNADTGSMDEDTIALGMRLDF